jgi:hypothetical protein
MFSIMVYEETGTKTSLLSLDSQKTTALICDKIPRVLNRPAYIGHPILYCLTSHRLGESVGVGV